MFRFYNGGNADDLTLPYSVDARNAYYYIRIKEKDFFEVPETIRVEGKPWFTNFDFTIPTRKGLQGVVRVDPAAEDTEMIGSLGRIAKSDEEARRLGDEIHRNYLINLVQDYKNRVEDFLAQGLHPLPAQGYVKYALKALNIEDPAEPVKNHVNKASESEDIKALKEEVEQLKKSLKKNA